MMKINCQSFTKIYFGRSDRMIRGFYNGLDSAEVDLMIQDIRYLLYKSSVRL
ncbi:MAG: hypothetical protein IPH61_09160 [Bacteroidetes bacterium]|nr:hypothetical protein [Bacteroidota bacterium]